MDAVILAAGAGTRLRPLTAECPKCLVPVGSQALLDHQIRSLAAAGVDTFHLVIGYREQMVRDHCGDGTRYGVRIHYVVNEDWATTNSIYSLYLTRKGWDEAGTFLCNCDILFDARLPQRLVEGAGSRIAVDTSRPRIAGEMNVQIDPNRCVVAISKQLAPETTQAVSAQIILLRDSDGRRVCEEVERFVKAEHLDTFPTAAYGPVVEARRLEAVDVSGLPWAEIDSVEEHEDACRTCAPRLI